jgi:hypothetical protein
MFPKVCGSRFASAGHAVRRLIHANITNMTSLPWKPSKGVAYFLGVLTVWPAIYFCLFMSFILFTFGLFGGKPGRGPTVGLLSFIFPLHFLTMLVMFGLTAVYVVHAFRTDEITADKRTLWVIILFFGNMLAFPVYWWLYLRPGRPVRSEEQSTGSSDGS